MTPGEPIEGVRLTAESLQALDTISLETGQPVAALVDMLLAFWEPHLIDAAAMHRRLAEIQAVLHAAVYRHCDLIDQFGVNAKLDELAADIAQTIQDVETATKVWSRLPPIDVRQALDAQPVGVAPGAH